MRVYNVKFFFIFENRFFLTKKFQKNDPKITFFHFLKNVIFRVFSISPKMSFFGTKWPKSLRNPKYYFHGLWQLTTPQKGSKTLKVPKMHSKAPTGKFFSLMMVKNRPPRGVPKVSKMAFFDIFEKKMSKIVKRDPVLVRNRPSRGSKIDKKSPFLTKCQKKYRYRLPKIGKKCQKRGFQDDPKITTFYHTKCQKYQLIPCSPRV